MDLDQGALLIKIQYITIRTNLKDVVLFNTVRNTKKISYEKIDLQG